MRLRWLPEGFAASYPAVVPLDPRIAADLRRRHQALVDTRPEHRVENLNRAYETFRREFGPDRLAALSGETLLRSLHGRNTRDSLVYWLEFKADEELPGIFGSIAGGSALKFGIYESRDIGDWMTGSAKSQRRLELAEAVAIAERQRDQLVAGCRVLADYAERPLEADYEAIQQRMVENAPDLAESAWGHKYFALCFPALLDDFHATSYQAFHQVKLLHVPVQGGRYCNAKVFIEAARELGVPVCSLGTVLNERNGPPHRYWRVGTRNGEEPARAQWPPMRDGGYAGIGWLELGDLSELPGTREGKESIRAAMERDFPNTASQVGKNTKQVFDFLVRVQKRDLVLAADGQTILGIGRVTGDYTYETKGPGAFAHRRPVEWLSFEEWKTPIAEGLRSTFREFRKHGENLVETERRLLDAREASGSTGARTVVAAQTLAPLSGHMARISSILQRKGQVILYGPPGTGKTYWAQKTARELIARSWFQRPWAELGKAEKAEMEERRALEVVCFHPAYGYEEFLEGYRPTVEQGTMVFERRDGLFKQLCDRARADRDREYVLIIDEINRGDVPRIFGELMMVLERSKREESISLPVSGRAFSVPGNVLVIATMNTADRSIALLDAALRRRFGFIELMPDYGVLRSGVVGGIPLGAWLEELNKRVLQHLGRDARNLQIGHSYLMHSSEPIAKPDRFASALHDDIVPLLEEHCYEDFETLGRILGDDLVDVREQRIAHELFEPSRRDDLFQALARAFEGLETAASAVTEELEEDEGEDEESEDESGQ